MNLLVDVCPARDENHLVDRVGELEAPILHLDGGPADGEVASVDMGR